MPCVPCDIIQIGPFAVPKAVLDVIMPLLGVIIGGLITYWITTAAEVQRWEQQKKDRKQERYREALEMALDWISPIESTVFEIESISSSLIMKNVSRVQAPAERWPDLVSKLSKLEKSIPARLRVLLPPAAYNGVQIHL